MAQAQLKQTELEFKNSNSNTGSISFTTANEFETDRAFKFSSGLVTSSLSVGSGTGFEISTDFGTISADNVNFKDGSDVKLTVKAPTSLDAAYTLTLPANNGQKNQFLQTDGSGNLTFKGDLINWDGFDGDPANEENISLLGDASYITSGTQKYLRLTSGASESGLMKYNHGSTLPTKLNFVADFQFPALGGLYCGLNFGASSGDVDAATDSLPFLSGYSLFVDHSSTNNTAQFYISKTNGSGGTTNALSQSFTLGTSTHTSQFLSMRGRITPSGITVTLGILGQSDQTFTVTRTTDESGGNYWNNFICAAASTNGSTYGENILRSFRVYAE